MIDVIYFIENFNKNDIILSSFNQINIIDKEIQNNKK